MSALDGIFTYYFFFCILSFIECISETAQENFILEKSYKIFKFLVKFSFEFCDRFPFYSLFYIKIYFI